MREETRLQANASSNSPGLSMMPKGAMQSPMKNGGMSIDRTQKNSMINSPMVLSPLNKTMGFTNRGSLNLNKTHQVGGFSFLTQIPGHDEPVDLLELENRKAAQKSIKAVTSVKLKIMDDFKRREMDRDLTGKSDKASRTAR